MKKIMLLAALLVLLIAPASLAQNQRVQATLTVADSGSCGVAVPTSGSSLALGLNSNSGATVIQASDPAGTFTGTIQFQRTADGTNWVTAPSTDATPVTSATAPGAWQVNVAGYQAVRACLSNQSAGSLTVVITSSVASAATHGGSGSGSGTVNAGLAHQPAFYPASGTAVSGTCTVPATNGQFPMLFNVTADAAVDPSCPQSGFVNTPITGAATTYTIKSADNLQGIEHDVAGSQSVTYSLPTPTTLENPQFAIPQICNYSTHTDTLTPVTWTINSSASVTIISNQCRSLSVDPFNATNWLAPITVATGAPSGPAGGCLSGTYPNPTTGQCSAPNQNVIYLSPNCGTQTNCIAVHADGVQITDGVVNGTTTVTSAGQAHWAAADVGKTIVGFYNSAGGGLGCAVTNTFIPTQVIGNTSSLPTIASVQSATQITLSAIATGGSHSGICIDYGTPDDTGFSALDTILGAETTTCPMVQLPGGRMMLAAGHFNFKSDLTHQHPCSNNDQVYGGTVGVPPTFVVSGQRGASILDLLPTFNFSTCTGGAEANGCFMGQYMSLLSDVVITGDGVPFTSGTEAVTMLPLNCGKLQNLGLLFFGYNSALGGITGMKSECIVTVSTDTLINVVDDGFGSVGLRSSVNSNLVGSNVAITDNCVYPIYMGSEASGSTIIIQGGMNAIGQNECAASAEQVAYVLGSSAYFETDARIYSASAAPHLVQVNGAGATAVLDGGWVEALNTGGINLVTGVSTAVIKVVNERFTLDTGSLCFNSGQVYDLGGNNFAGGTCTSTGNVYGTASITGTALTAAKLVLSAGWGSTAAVTVPLGANSPISFTITNSGTGQGASPTITYTFPTPYLQAPLWCVATDVGGTNPLLTAFTPSSLTATGVVFTATGTPTVSDTELMQVQCFTQ